MLVLGTQRRPRASGAAEAARSRIAWSRRQKDDGTVEPSGRADYGKLFSGNYLQRWRPQRNLMPTDRSISSENSALLDGFKKCIESLPYYVNGGTTPSCRIRLKASSSPVSSTILPSTTRKMLIPIQLTALPVGGMDPNKPF